VKDSQSGVVSINPQVIRGLSYRNERIADHDPIVADIISR
jgi:hypothetical protein